MLPGEVFIIALTLLGIHQIFVMVEMYIRL